MSNSTNIVLQEAPDATPLYLYQHSAGCPLKDVAAMLMASMQRWGDTAYANRIALQYIFNKQFDAVTGCGVSVFKTETDHEVTPTIRWHDNKVEWVCEEWDSDTGETTTHTMTLSFDETIWWAQEMNTDLDAPAFMLRYALEMAD